MLIELIIAHCKFAFIVVRFFFQDLLLKRGEKSFVAYGLLGSCIALFLVSHPILKILSYGTLVVSGIDALDDLMTLHRMFFCCGLHFD